MTLKGDHLGIVSVKFTVDTLEAFIELFNRARVERVPGAVVTLRVDEYEPGCAELIATTELIGVPL